MSAIFNVLADVRRSGLLFRPPKSRKSKYVSKCFLKMLKPAISFSSKCLWVRLQPSHSYCTFCALNDVLILALGRGFHLVPTSVSFLCTQLQEASKECPEIWHNRSLILRNEQIWFLEARDQRSKSLWLNKAMPGPDNPISVWFWPNSSSA